jgi:hypothetical protein
VYHHFGFLQLNEDEDGNKLSWIEAGWRPGDYSEEEAAGYDE